MAHVNAPAGRHVDNAIPAGLRAGWYTEHGAVLRAGVEEPASLHRDPDGGPLEVEDTANDPDRTGRPREDEMIVSARVYTRTQSAAAPGDGLALQNTPWSRGERPGVRRHPGYASEPGKRGLRAETADLWVKTIVGARARTCTHSEAAPGAGGLLQDN